MQERKRLDVTVVYLHQAFISFVVLYKRGFVMFGVVSLTMGNSVGSFGYCGVGASGIGFPSGSTGMILPNLA